MGDLVEHRPDCSKTLGAAVMLGGNENGLEATQRIRV